MMSYEPNTGVKIMKKVLAIVSGFLLLGTVTAMADNYVESDKLSWAESTRIYLEYFPQSVGM
jgi:hypothetical protein